MNEDDKYIWLKYGYMIVNTSVLFAFSYLIYRASGSIILTLILFFAFNALRDDFDGV